MANVPAAALTAYARWEDRAKALRASFGMHLAKPVVRANSSPSSSPCRPISAQPLSGPEHLRPPSHSFR